MNFYKEVTTNSYFNTDRVLHNTMDQNVLSHHFVT